MDGRVKYHEISMQNRSIHDSKCPQQMYVVITGYCKLFNKYEG